MKPLQTNLFKSIDELQKQPLVLAYGLGVDSTAVLVELYKRNIRPDAILFADTGDEKIETYDYLPIINNWLKQVGFPQVTVVKYIPKNFKHWPPYHTLGQNCLTNATLPSLAFGFKSCSLKWKVVPQNQWTDQWTMATDYWYNGGKVRKIIGYDASAKDLKRYAHAQGIEDPKYDYWYPLIEWNMDRDACKESIKLAGLPIPPKSACKFCPATQPLELHQHRKEYLRFIIIMEARAKSKLEGCMTEQELKADFHSKHTKWLEKTNSASGKTLDKLLSNEPKLKEVGKGCAGLWRTATKKRPAMMTDYIRAEKLLSDEEINYLQKQIPSQIIQNQYDFIKGDDFLNWHDFLEQFSEEDALDEIPFDCVGCNIIH